MTSIVKRLNSLRQQILCLQVSSALCAVIGGVILASNTVLSKYGFVFLPLSSSQLLIASIREKNKVMTFYAASLFFFVDCLGAYRWLLH